MTIITEHAARKRFTKNTAEHTMTVLHDDGLYRHLRFAQPGTGTYWFELITWPGHLTITGDMGTYVFARLEDMFVFFRGSGINPGYWSEKLRADSGVKAYSDRLFKEQVNDAVLDERFDSEAERISLVKAVEREVLQDPDTDTEQGARDAIKSFEHDGFRFHDAWEWDLTDYTPRFLWCCHAIRWGITQFDTVGKAPK